MSFCVASQLMGCTFTREELLNQAQRLAALTDHELVEQGLSATLDFAPFRVSGAALTVGFMNALGMDKIRAIEVNMAGGILLESDFWMGALKGGSSEERVESSGWIWAIAILLVVAVFTAVFVTQRQLFSWTCRASNALTTHRGGFVSQRRKGQDLPLVLTAGEGLDRESGSRSRLCDRVRYGSFEKSTERGRLRFRITKASLFWRRTAAFLWLILAALVLGRGPGLDPLGGTIPLLFSVCLAAGVLILFLVGFFPTERQIAVDRATDRLERDGKLVCHLGEIDAVTVTEEGRVDFEDNAVEVGLVGIALRSGKEINIFTMVDQRETVMALARTIANYAGVDVRMEPRTKPASTRIITLDL